MEAIRPSQPGTVCLPLSIVDQKKQDLGAAGILLQGE